MKKTKKGVTLVELVICCAIIVMLGGACTAVLLSGHSIFNTSSKAANAQLDSDVLQTYMMNLLPSAKNVDQLSLAEAKALTSGNSVYFDDENGDVFTLQIDGEKNTIRSIAEFEYSIARAGDSASSTARAQFLYTVTMTDGSSFTGGFVLSNMKYDDTSMATMTGKVSEAPFCFGIPEAAT